MSQAAASAGFAAYLARRNRRRAWESPPLHREVVVEPVLEPEPWDREVVAMHNLPCHEGQAVRT